MTENQIKMDSKNMAIGNTLRAHHQKDITQFRQPCLEDSDKSKRQRLQPQIKRLHLSKEN